MRHFPTADVKMGESRFLTIIQGGGVCSEKVQKPFRASFQKVGLAGRGDQNGTNPKVRKQEHLFTCPANKHKQMLLATREIISKAKWC